MKQIKFLNSLPFLHMASMNSYCYGEILCQPHGIMQTQIHATLPLQLPSISLYMMLDQRAAQDLKTSSISSQHTLARHWFLAASAPEQMTTFPTCYSQEENPTTSQGT